MVPAIARPKLEGNVAVGDDRQLGFAEFGAPWGRTVFWLHGTPGARRQIPPEARVYAENNNIRLIGLDRPGIGSSTPHRYENIRAFADDLQTVADTLGVDKMAIVGLSGGGPYSLACAAAMGDRVVGLAVLGGVAPTQDPEAISGGAMNLGVRVAPLLKFGGSPLRVGASVLVQSIRPVGSAALYLYALASPEADRHLLTRPEIGAMFLDDLLNGSRKQLDAPFNDVILFARDWGFRLEEVKVPVRWWHGDHDHIIPFAHGEHVVSLLPDAELYHLPEESHLAGLGRGEEILSTLMKLWDERDDVLLASLNPSAVTTTDIADAVRIDGEVLSRSDLVGAATSVAERVGGAHRVAVLATPTVATVLAITGCLIAGVPVVPVPADVGAAERRHMLTDSGAQAWLGPVPDQPEGLPHIPVRLHARSWHRYPEPAPDATAMVIYTSGTTGLPKGVQLSRRAIAADLDALAAAWQWSADDVLVHGLPLFHVHGLVLGLLGSLRIGNRFVHTGKPKPESYASASGTMYFGVPTVWSRVVADEAAAAALRSARLLVSGSAPLPVPVFDRLAQLTGHQPVERYGATESLITLSTLADGERRAGWVGLPLAGVQTRLVDDDGAEVPHDGETVGKLHVRGPMLFDGYLNRPEATAEAFDGDGYYRTGDVAVIDADGMHRIVGRESVDLIKSGGYRIGAGEIETALLGHPGVDEAAVVGLPDEDLGQRIVAFVVGSAQPDDLIQYVAEQLSVHKRPREVRIVDSLPRNAMGKVLKKQLLSEG